MKAIFSKSLIPAVLVIAGLAAGTGLLAGYIDSPAGTPQAAVDAQCEGCPLLGTDACCKVTGVCANPQACTNPCVGTAASAAPCATMAATATPCTGLVAGEASCMGMAATITPCTGAEGCPMPCCQKAGEAPPAGCTMGQPQPTGCPFMTSSAQTASPCCAGGCTQAK